MRWVEPISLKKDFLFSFRDCSAFYSVIIFFEYYSIKCQWGSKDLLKCWYSYFLFIMVYFKHNVWRLVYSFGANSNNIQKLLGCKKVIKASDIYYFERNSNGSLIIVCSDETKVSFEPEYADSIMLWMSEQSITTNNARKKDRFIIRPAKYQRVLSVLCFFAFGNIYI